MLSAVSTVWQPVPQATKVSYWLTERGMTRAELHRRTGINVSTLRRIQLGEHVHPPNLRHLVNIAHALGVSLGDLLEDDWLVPTLDDRPLAAPVSLAATPPTPPGSPRSVVPQTVIEQAALLVRWLNSPNFRRFTQRHGVQPEQAILAQARDLGLTLTATRLTLNRWGDQKPVWLIFANPRDLAPLAAIIARRGDGYRLFAP